MPTRTHGIALLRCLALAAAALCLDAAVAAQTNAAATTSGGARPAPPPTAAAGAVSAPTAATPVWHPRRRGVEFALFRHRFALPCCVESATLRATAQASPAWHSPDAGNMPKLLGAYRVALDGAFLAAGPGRNRNGVQPVDTIDVTAALRAEQRRQVVEAGKDAHARSASTSHVLAASCYHTNRTAPPPSPCRNAACPSPWGPGAATPRLILELTVTVANPRSGDTRTVVVSTADRATDGSGRSAWESADGTRRHNPSGNAGTVWYSQPQENIDARVLPGWWLQGAAGGRGGHGDFNSSSGGSSSGGSSSSGSSSSISPDGVEWLSAAFAPPFVLPLEAKRARTVRTFETSVTLTRRGPGHYVVDCGKEISGGLAVRVRAGAARDGQRVSVGYGEELLDTFTDPSQPNSTLGCDGCTVRCCPMRTTNVFRSEWVLSSAGGPVLEHEYKQFRFAELVSADGGAFELEAGDVAAWVARYPFGSDAASGGGNGVGGGGGGGVGGGDDGDVTTRISTHISSGDSGGVDLAAVGVPSGLTTFGSSDADLDRVWALAQYTIVAGALDTSTDSNNRQRSTCHIDMRVASLGMLFATDGSAAPQVAHNAALMLQNNSDILDGWADFKAATVYTAHLAALHDPANGALGVARAAWPTLRLFTLRNFYNRTAGLIDKPSANTPGWACLGGASPCAGDLIDWPPNARDGYVLPNNTLSTVPNAYAAQAMALLSELADWLGKSAEAADYAAAAASLRASIVRQLFDQQAGLFRDGVGVGHHSVHASIVAAATGAVTHPAVAGSVLAVLERRGLFEGGVLTTCWIAGATLEALYAMAAVTADGRAAEVARRYMGRRGNRSWTGMMDRHNATMTMEAWDPEDNNGSETGGEGITFAHPWCSGPAHAVPRLLMGVSPSSRRWASVLVRPQPGALTRANLTLRTHFGVVSVALEQIDIDLTRPGEPGGVAAAAEIRLTLGVCARADVGRCGDGADRLLAVPARVCLPPPFGVPSASAPALVNGGGAVVPANAEGRFLCANRTRSGVLLRRAVRCAAAAASSSPVAKHAE